MLDSEGGGVLDSVQRVVCEGGARQYVRGGGARQCAGSRMCGGVLDSM